VRSRKATRLTKCVACEIKAMCGMCPANAELEAGDPETPVDFLCHVAHLRAHALGVAVPPHGACEYCEGGERHRDLMTSLARLRAAVPAGVPAPQSQVPASRTGSPRRGQPAHPLSGAGRAEDDLP
jgi:hypothetical protein